MASKYFATCRRCGERKPISSFRKRARDCEDCRKEGPTNNFAGRQDWDPFRRHVDIEGLDRFLRRPLP